MNSKNYFVLSPDLMRWAQQRYKRLRPFRKARKWWQELTARQPRLFAHWAWTNDIAYGSDETSGVKGDFHAPFCGSPGVRFPWATRRPLTGRSWRRYHSEVSRKVSRNCGM
jgi:hypothetical protein